MNKYARYGLRAFLWIFGVLLIVWLALYIYISMNTGMLKEKITSEIKNKARGEVTIGKVSPSFFRTFPFISLEISDIVIRDSMWQKHKHDFFNAKSVYLRVSPVSLLTKSRIGRVILRSGSIYLYSDTTGYSNEYILAGKNTVTEEDSQPGALPDLAVHNFLFTMENPIRNKYHRILVQKLVAGIDDEGDAYDIDVNTRMMIHSLAFNTDKGSYMKEKPLTGDFDLAYNKLRKTLTFSGIDLKLDNQRFRFTGLFTLDKAKADFNLSIVGKDVDFNKAVQVLPDSIRTKVDAFSFEKPVSFSVDVSGKTLYKLKALVNVHMDIKENTLNTSFGSFRDVAFKSSFSNLVDPSLPPLDENSMILVEDFSGNWNEIIIKSDSIKISHLKRPYLECKIKSDFDLKSLNKLTGSNTLNFISGKTHVDLAFKGPIGGTDSIQSSMDGVISMKDAKFHYIPRDINFTNGNGAIHFRGKDLIVHRLNVSTGKTNLTMDGNAENFLSLLNISPEKLTLRWNVESPHIYLDDFKGFLTKTEAQKAEQKQKAMFERTAGNIDKMFVDGDVHLQLKTPAITYNRFRGSNLQARVLLEQNRVEIENASMNHANGSMSLKGTMTDNGKSNSIDIKTTMTRMDIPKLFYAFGNFGQDAVTDKNLKGQLSATVNLKSSISNNASLLKESSSGTIDFLLENGELNNFEPIQKISDKVFKKQDFSKIEFADLKNKLELNGTAFVINKMEIRSTALILFIEGVYDLVKGTDLSIQVPVRNLLKSNKDVDLSDEGKKNRGVSLRLRAKTGEDGKLNVSWDPFGRSKKNKEEAKSR